MDRHLGKHQLGNLITVKARNAQPSRAIYSENDLTRISRALERMAIGEYGYCTLCGVALALDQLEEDPASEACPTCD